ncbi:DUF1622 domain-containing protein [Vreelandella rituensis]|nr:DUF1622 domain-containing protein [Halomonas rituensis]
MEQFITIIDFVALGVEAAGVVVIVAGFIFATYRFLRNPKVEGSTHQAYLGYRHAVGRSLLIGLDFLIAGDLIKTVIIANTGSQVATLAAVVLVRAFLAFTLHIEIEGQLPWHASKTKPAPYDGNKPSSIHQNHQE